MRKKSLLQWVFLLFALIVGTGNTWADEVTLSYSGSTTTNMTGNNDAATVGLSATEWSVVGYKGSASNFPGLNKAGQIRLYYNASGSNYIEVSSLTDATINSITVTYGSSNYNAIVKVGSSTITDTNNTNATGQYAINSSSFTIENGYSSNTQVYILSIVINYTPATPSYTITAESNNDSYGTVSLSGSVITGSPNSGYRYASPAYTVFPANSATVSQEGNAFTVTPSANTTVTINFEAIPTHTAHFSIDGAIDTNNDCTAAEGAAITFPANPDAISGKSFVGWVTSPIDGTTNTAPSLVTSATMGSNDVTYYAVFADVEGSATHENLVINTSTENFPTAYGTANTFTEYTLNGKKFKIQQGYINGTKLQWRADGNTNGTGTIYNSEAINNIQSIVLVYDSSDPNKNFTLKVGDSENPTSGTSITPSASNLTYTFDCSEWNCDYFVLTNGSGAGYLTSITINYLEGSQTVSNYCTTVVATTVATPVITLGANPFTFSTTATITCATENATIKYSYDGENWNDYSSALTITETKTIYAKAIKGSDESSVAQVTATKNLATPTVSVSGDLTLDLDGGTDINAGTLSASVTYNNSTVSGATVTWSSNNTAVATIDESTGVVTLLTTGIVTFTATYAGNSDYAEATGSKTVTVVDSNAPGTTQQNPYTVAQAIENTPSSGTSSNVYIRGIVSAFYNTSIVDDGTNYRYYISDDGTTTNQLLVYKGKKNSTDAFSSADDLEIGDVVVIYGGLTTYNSTKEVASGNYIVSRTTKTASDLTKTNDINLSEASLSTTADATDYFTTSSTGALSYEIANTSVATVSDAGVVTPVAAGTTTLTVSQAADATYKAGSLEITVTVAAASLNETTIYASASGSTTYGTNKEEDYLIDDTYDGIVVAVSSNTSVATVTITQHTSGEGTFTITPVAVGTAVITISAPATATCEAADDVTYTITVNAPTGGTTAAESGFVKVTATEDITGGEYLIVYEDGNLAFDGSLDGLDAVENTIEVEIENNKIAADATTTASTFTIAAVADGYSIKSASDIYIGQTSDANGMATSGETVYTNTISFEDNGDVNIIGSGGAYLRYNSSNNQTRFRYYKSSTYSGQKAIQLYKLSEGITVTLPSSGIGSYCCQYPLDFSEATDYKAYIVTGISGRDVTFERVAGQITGGVPVVLYGESGATITLTSCNSTTEPNFNMLRGTLAPTYITTTDGDYTNFVLSGGKFKKVNNGVLAAHKAYLPILTNNLPSGTGANEFRFIFDDSAVTGVKTIENVTIENGEWYTLDGRRLNGKPTQRGLYIVNGTKVVVK